VVFSTNTQINGTFDVSVAAGVSGAVTLTVAGNLTTAAGSAVTMTGVTLGGGMNIGGTFTPTTVTFVGASQTIQAGLGYQNVVLAGSGTAAFAASQTVTGNLTVSSGTLDLAGITLTVTGNFTTSNPGVLKMQNPAGVLTVNGATLFGGGDTTGLLTAGTLNAKGSFTSNSSSFTNFAASGAHLTVLNGTAAQTVSFIYPGATNNRFQNLLITNTVGVSLATNAVVNGTLTASGTSPKPKIIGNGKSLTVVGSNVTGLDLDNVLLVINWNGVSPLVFDNVDLRNYPDAATRITITAASIPSVTFNGLNFTNGVPILGILVNATDTNGGTDFLLDIQSNLTPSLADARTVKNGGATVTWR
jgi:hypothetical protein